MNRKELVQAVSDDVGTDVSIVGEVLDWVLYRIVVQVARGETVELRGFGRFLSAQRATRMTRSPKTGLMIRIPATTVPVFRPGAAFKGSVAPKKPGGSKGVTPPLLAIER